MWNVSDESQYGAGNFKLQEMLKCLPSSDHSLCSYWSGVGGFAAEM